MGSLIASLIDHSLLQPALIETEIEAGCALARRYRVASVCVKPYAVPLAVRWLAGCQVAIGTVVGFPHGSHATETKAFEAELACQQGASELDMVVNIGRVISQDWEFVEQDIRAVVAVARRHGAITKVIFENDLLPGDELKVQLCQLCTQVEADFVKTSTGFGFVKKSDGTYNYRGATEDDVRLMRQHIGAKLQVKAAGGIRTYEDAVKMVRAGASRIGATATEAIVAGETSASVPLRIP